MTEATITGPAASEFSLLDPLQGITIPPSGSDTVRIRYTPVGYGARSAFLNVKTTAPNASDFQISLRARRDTAAVEAVERIIDFGPVLSCETERDTVVTLLNTGTLFDTLGVRTASGEVFTVDTSGRYSLYPGGSLQISLRLSGGAEGMLRDTLLISGTPCGVSDRVILQAERISPILSATPLSFDTLYACQGALTRGVTLHNGGRVVDTLRRISIAGSAAYSIVAPGEVVLPPGGDTTIEVTFTPGGSGVITGALSIDWRPCEGSLQVPLDAVVIEPNTTLSAPSIDFGAVQVGSPIRRSVTIHNGSAAPRTITSIDLGGAAGVTMIQPGSLPATIAPGGDLLLQMEFDPDSAGILDAAGSISVAGPCPETLTFTLTGTGEGSRTLTVTAELGTTDLSAPVDAEVDIPVRIIRSTNLATAETDSIAFLFSYRRTMLLPLRITTPIPGADATLSSQTGSGENAVVLATIGGAQLPASGTIATITARVLIGDTTSTLLSLFPQGFGFARNDVAISDSATGGSATFTTLGLCTTGGTRTVRLGGASLKPIVPDPLGAQGRVEFELQQHTSVEIRLLDLRGTEALHLFSGTLDPGRYSLPIDGSRLASGLYLCELRTPNGAVHELVVKVE